MYRYSRIRSVGEHERDSLHPILLLLLRFLLTLLLAYHTLVTARTTRPTTIFTYCLCGMQELSHDEPWITNEDTVNQERVRGRERERKRKAHLVRPGCSHRHHPRSNRSPSHLHIASLITFTRDLTQIMHSNACKLIVYDRVKRKLKSERKLIIIFC